MTAQTRGEIAALLQRHGISPSHRLGQHFLADANITRKVVSVAGVGTGSKVVEVGAGTGTLTRALVESGARVVSYEVDQRLRPLLAETVGGLDVDLRFEDVTDIDLAATLDGDGWTMVANLPYNVGTRLILDAMRRVMEIESFVVMVQAEVARRLVAEAGEVDYGLPSVIAHIHTEPSIALFVPPQVFVPAPRVDSAVVVARRRPAPAEAERAIDLARAGFGQRRKMLRRSLAGVYEDPEVILHQAGIDPTARAEDLTPDDYLRLAAD